MLGAKGKVSHDRIVPSAEDVATLAELPATFDARLQWPQCITPIRNQGSCGSCYLVSSVSAFSDRVCIQMRKNSTVILAPQAYLECGGGGCNGGAPSSVFNFM